MSAKRSALTVAAVFNIALLRQQTDKSKSRPFSGSKPQEQLFICAIDSW